MKARIKISKQTYVISVSLYKGCYRHIKIASDKTLEQLSQAILFAFEFDNDHLHAFFMDNRRWGADAYFAMAEHGQRDTSKFRLGQLGLVKDRKFIYLFDFGDEWCFSCKVLKVLEDTSEETQIVRSIGDPPEQYPGYNDKYDSPGADGAGYAVYDDDEDDDAEYIDIKDEDEEAWKYGDSLYAAAFGFSSGKS